jgi:hypothetical protein
LHSEIHHVVVGTRNPSGDDPLDKGDSEEGWYTVEDGLLTMVTVDGVALRNGAGERITARLTDGTAPRTIAARLVLSRWRNERDATEGVRDFGRPIRYSEPYGGY